MTSLPERIYWHSQSYGRAVRIRRCHVLAGYLAIAVAIPVIVPVWGVMVLRKLLRQDVIWRYA